jgi:hypothetical protein
MNRGLVTFAVLNRGIALGFNLGYFFLPAFFFAAFFGAAFFLPFFFFGGAGSPPLIMSPAILSFPFR